MVILTKQTPKHGFTLIEMIGVLAVIAILSALLIPKVFESINNARVNNACVTLSTVKTAVADHFAKYGTIPLDGVANTVLVPAANGLAAFDEVLLKEAFIDKPFAVKISADAGNDVMLFSGQAAAVDPDGLVGSFNLDGAGAAGAMNDVANANAVVVAKIIDTTAQDAFELSTRLDGPDMSNATLTGADLEGRVIYATPVAGKATVLVYITHR
jgi:prepilin-type N-terminal cleavage/methylation domain-containing protein